jgi:predicted TIM-barrel fold metal-dependent hydrolase
MTMELISADSHVIEPPNIWVNALGDKFGDLTPRLINEYKGEKGNFFFSQRQTYKYDTIYHGEEGRRASGHDPDVRLRFQNDGGITAEIIYPTLTGVVSRGDNRAAAHAFVRVYNDWISEFCSADPQRLWGVGVINIDNPEIARAEVEHCHARGLRAIKLPSAQFPGCPPLRDKQFDPVWATCQDLGMPVTLHIGTGNIRDPFHFLEPGREGDVPAILLSIFSEVQALLANEFIFGGILDRFPRLGVLLSEWEISWIPQFMYRLDQVQADFSNRLSLPTLDMKASEYLTQRMLHGVIDDRWAAEVVRMLGVDCIAWGSDYPHTRSIGIEADSHLQSMFAGFSEKDKLLIRAGNIRRFFGDHTRAS